MIKKLITSSKFQLASLIFIAFIFSFLNLSKRRIEVWDEYTNFNVVYDTIKSKSFPLLTLQNEHFLEKPPLWYWLTICSTNIFGLNNFSLRFVSALSGFVLIISIYFLGRKLFSHEVGIISSLILLSTRQLFIINTSIFSTHLIRSGDLDSLQILLLVLTTFSIVKFHKKKNNHFWLIASGILTSLGFLVKGPFSLVPIIIFILYYVLNRKLIAKERFLIKICIFFVTFLIINLPWHIFMYIKFGNEFINEYFLYHIVKRGLSTIEEHYGNIFYYIIILFRKDFYFSGELLLIAFIYLINHYKKKVIKDFKLFTILSTSLVLFIIPTMIQTKLAWYILPFYPYSSIVVGKFIENLCESEKNKLNRIIIYLILLLITVNIYLNYGYIINIKFPVNHV